jgi:hypothetical protein
MERTYSSLAAAAGYSSALGPGRTRAQLQAFVGPVLATACAIDGLYRQFGPAGLWPLADPAHWSS